MPGIFLKASFANHRIPAMKIKLFFFACALFAAVSPMRAGPVELESKEMAPAPTINESEP